MQHYFRLPIIFAILTHTHTHPCGGHTWAHRHVYRQIFKWIPQMWQGHLHWISNTTTRKHVYTHSEREGPLCIFMCVRMCGVTFRRHCGYKAELASRPHMEQELAPLCGRKRWVLSKCLLQFICACNWGRKQQTDRQAERERVRQTERQTQLAQLRSLAIDMETAVVASSPSPHGDCGYFSISISVCTEPRNHILSKCLTLSSSVEKACSPTYLSEEDSHAALYRSYSRITHTHTQTLADSPHWVRDELTNVLKLIKIWHSINFENFTSKCAWQTAKPA